MLVARQEERELFRFVVVHLGVGDDTGPERMIAGEDAEVSHHVERRRRDQSTQAGEEGGNCQES
jgi:hypothetical protein